MSGTDVSLTEVLEQTIAIALQQTDGPTYAIVNTYDASSQRASVTPLIPKLTAGTLEITPTLPSVPVEWPETASHAIKFPLPAGSIVAIEPKGHDHGTWLTTGTANAPPESERRFSLADFVARPLKTIPSNVVANALTYHASKAVLFGEWLVGDSGATKAVGLNGDLCTKKAGDAVYIWMTQVETAVNALSAPATPVNPLSSTFSQMAKLAATSTKLKAK